MYLQEDSHKNVFTYRLFKDLYYQTVTSIWIPFTFTSYSKLIIIPQVYSSVEHFLTDPQKAEWKLIGIYSSYYSLY